MSNNLELNTLSLNDVQEIYERHFGNVGLRNQIGQLVVTIRNEETAYDSNYDTSSDFNYNVHLIYSDLGIFNAVGNYLCNWNVIREIMSLITEVENLERLVEITLERIVSDYSLFI